MRTLELGARAVLRSVGGRTKMTMPLPRWFIANWFSVFNG